jgi:hypothetical protein
MSICCLIIHSTKQNNLKKEESMSCDFIDITIDGDGIHIDIEW